MAKSETESRPAGPCRICGAQPTASLVAYGIVHDRCGRCGTLQKRLTEEDYRRLEVTYDEGAYLDTADREEIERFLDVEDKVALLRWATAPLERKRNFLDIGCGMGGNLLAARRLGFEVTGVEPSKQHARVAKELLRLDVIDDYFTPAAVKGRTFDLVMLSHVIEHIYSPKEFLREILSVIAPGGMLIVVTPNAESLVARVAGKDWPMLVPVDHVNLLGPAAPNWLFDPGISWIVRTSEYPHEFGSAVLAGIRRRFLGGSKPADPHSSAEPCAGGEPALMQRVDLRTRLLKAGLTIASAPFYLWSRLRHRSAALTIVARKPEDSTASAA